LAHFAVDFAVAFESIAVLLGIAVWEVVRRLI
jgi:hypothetical protein